MSLIKISAFCALAFGVLSVPACAGIQDIESANNQIAGHLQNNNTKYYETVNGSLLDSESSHISGYGLSASVMKDLWSGRDYFLMKYRTFEGDPVYTGGSMANPLYGSVLGESYAKVRDYSIRYGKGFVFDDDLMLTPYVELGYHHYDRTLGYGTPTSYQEIYTHNAYGVGILGQCSPSDSLVYSAYMFIGRTFNSHIVVVLAAPYTGFSAKLGNSTLYQVGASIDYAFTKNIHANLGVYAAGWQYGASASQPIGGGLSAYEPDSETSITTIDIGIGYSF